MNIIKPLLIAAWLPLMLCLAAAGIAHAQDYQVQPTPDFAPADVVTMHMRQNDNVDLICVITSRFHCR